MAYTVFERKAQRVFHFAVSIQKTGRIVLNTVASKLFAEKAVTTVLFLWDQERRKFAIRPTSRRDIRAFTVRLSDHKQKPSVAIHAKTFLDHIGVDLTETRQLRAEWDERKGLLEVELPPELFRHR